MLQVASSHAKEHNMPTISGNGEYISVVNTAVSLVFTVHVDHKTSVKVEIKWITNWVLTVQAIMQYSFERGRHFRGTCDLPIQVQKVCHPRHQQKQADPSQH